jgi:hypothetical protein
VHQGTGSGRKVKGKGWREDWGWGYFTKNGQELCATVWTACPNGRCALLFLSLSCFLCLSPSIPIPSLSATAPWGLGWVISLLQNSASSFWREGAANVRVAALGGWCRLLGPWTGPGRVFTYFKGLM